MSGAARDAAAVARGQAEVEVAVQLLEAALGRLGGQQLAGGGVQALEVRVVRGAGGGAPRGVARGGGVGGRDGDVEGDAVEAAAVVGGGEADEVAIEVATQCGGAGGGEDGADVVVCGQDVGRSGEGGPGLPAKIFRWMVEVSASSTVRSDSG